MNKHPFTLDFPGDSVIKNPPDNAGDTGDLGLNPGSGRSPGGENPMERRAWWATVHGVTKTQTRLNEWARVLGQRGPLVSLLGLSLLFVGAGVCAQWQCSVLAGPLPCDLLILQACGPAGEHTTWRADSLTKWHPGPHVLGKSCSLQIWAGKAHEIMSLAATWMDMEIIIGSEGSQTKTNIIWYHLFAKSEKNDTDELIYKTETDSQT